MRQLKLQMQTTFDGFVGPAADGGIFNWDKEVQDFSTDNLKGVDTVLLGGISEPFIKHWSQVAADPKLTDNQFAKTMMALRRVIFSNNHKAYEWENTTRISGDFVKEIKALKEQDGGDIIAYGGHSFARSLIQYGLVDQFSFLVNPIALGKGESIFESLSSTLPFRLKGTRSFQCGTVLINYSLR